MALVNIHLFIALSSVRENVVFVRQLNIHGNSSEILLNNLNSDATM